MNLVDIIIIILVIGALLRGQELGFVRQLFSTVGFFGGLLIGAIIEPHVVGFAHTALGRLAITLGTTIGMGLILLSAGELAGIRIKEKLQFEDGLNRVDNSFGAVLASVSLLALAWLSAAILVTTPYPNIQSSIRSSKIISLMN